MFLASVSPYAVALDQEFLFRNSSVSDLSMLIVGAGTTFLGDGVSTLSMTVERSDAIVFIGPVTMSTLSMTVSG